MPDLWVADAGGRNPVQLTSHFGSGEGCPKWSPDGRWIAFTSLQNGNADIWLMDQDGGGKKRLTHWPTMETEPSWSRDGSSIYFSSDRTGVGEIWSLELSGGEPQRITAAGGHIGYESANGKLLYYTKQASSPLFVRPLHGGAERQVLAWIEQRSFVVTADGIYYVGRRDAATNKALLSFYDFRSGRNWVIREINATPAMALAVSPDQRTALLPVFDPADGNPSADLMVIENFPLTSSDGRLAIRPKTRSVCSASAEVMDVASAEAMRTYGNILSVAAFENHDSFGAVTGGRGPRQGYGATSPDLF